MVATLMGNEPKLEHWWKFPTESCTWVSFETWYIRVPTGEKKVGQAFQLKKMANTKARGHETVGTAIDYSVFQTLSRMIKD